MPSAIRWPRKPRWPAKIERRLSVFWQTLQSWKRHDLPAEITRQPNVDSSSRRRLGFHFFILGGEKSG
jgi:hypothetical protein